MCKFSCFAKINGFEPCFNSRPRFVIISIGQNVNARLRLSAKKLLIQKFRDMLLSLFSTENPASLREVDCQGTVGALQI